MTSHEWVLILGAVGTVLGAYLAARIAGRSSVEVAQTSAKVDQKRAATEEFAAITNGLRVDLEAARGQIENMREREKVRVVREDRERDRREVREETQRATLMAHAAWDWTMIQAARRCSDPGHVDIPNPPPLHSAGGAWSGGDIPAVEDR